MVRSIQSTPPTPRDERWRKCPEVQRATTSRCLSFLPENTTYPTRVGRCQHVDFEQTVISVRFQLERKAKDATARRTRLKTTAARRDVEALPELIALLKKHKAKAFARGHARPEDFVFTTANGLPLMHRNVSRDFATAWR